MKCGSPVIKETLFCPNCGNKTASRTTPTNLTSGLLQKGRNDRGFVFLLCVITFLLAFVALNGLAILVSFLCVILFYFGWDSRRIGIQTKFLFFVSAIFLVLATQYIEAHIKSREAESAASNKKVEQDNQLVKKEAIARLVNEKFDALSQAEHLQIAQNLLHAGAAKENVDLGFHHLDALGTTNKEASRLRSQFKTTQADVDRIAALSAAKRKKEEAAEEAKLNEVIRVAMAKTIENTMLDEGFNMDVSAIGPHHTILKLRYVFVSKVFAHQFSKKSQIFDSARKAGFVKIVATGGYDENWTWNL